MLIHTHDRFKRVTINPGEYHAAKGAVTISTLLGSCVAACLFDPVRQVIGMNHFLLASTPKVQNTPMCGSEEGRYGVNAMELLINDMLALGAERKFLKAKVFGGASFRDHSGVEGAPSTVGQVNAKFIKEFLANENIPLLAQSLGGNDGRVIHFTNGDYAVYVRKLSSSRNGRVAQRDHDCWLKAIEIQEKAIPDVDLWI